jgi:dTDP-4-dehydrorhamnose reductase
MPRLLVLGGSGMLGHKIFQRLQRDFSDTYCTLRGEAAAGSFDGIPLFETERVLWGVDVLRTDAFHALLRRLRPDVIVNCIGVIKQRSAAKDAIPNIRINALLPHELAELCAEWHGRLIHFSTDCVFNGRCGSYREDDQSDAEDLYGRSKFLGEVSVPNAVTLRTSIVGHELTEHRSLLDWFLSQKKGATVRGFRRVIYSGITTNEMANVVTMIIRDLPGLSGLFQVAAEPITKYDLLALVRKAYGLDVTLEPDDRELSDRSMNGEKFRDATGWRAPSWPEMIRELAADPTPYEEWGALVLHTGGERDRETCSKTRRS